ncbi:MAG: hypothetical protein QXW70_01850 [Candidatus Anstonellales archaeon]
MHISKRSLITYFSKLGITIIKDPKNPSIFLVYPPGKPHEEETAKYLLLIPDKAYIQFTKLNYFINIAGRLRKGLLIPTSQKPPFNFVFVQRITKW